MEALPSNADCNPVTSAIAWVCDALALLVTVAHVALFALVVLYALLQLALLLLTVVLSDAQAALLLLSVV